MRGYLCFPVVHFKYKGKKKKQELLSNNLPHIDDIDDWWDYWFKIGKYTYQLCGDCEKKKRLFRNLVIYVYPAKDDYTDDDRIGEIREGITISFEPRKD